MADYAAPGGQVLPFVDLPSTSTPVTAAWLNAIQAMAVDVAAAGGRVASLETNGVRAVIVATGNETRPTAAVVLWVSPDGLTPTHAAATDLVFLSTTVTNTVAPTISGTATSGQTLTAGTGSWNTTPDSYTYVWRRAGTPISGATSSTYLLAGADVGSTITVTVTAVKSGWTSGSGTSAATATVAAGVIFSDTFNRANGAVGNSWAFVASGTGTIASNACTFGGWGGYATGAYRTGMSKAASVRAVYTSTVETFQGIFLAHSGTTGTGIRLLNTGGTWVVGDSASFGAHDATISAGGIPSSPWTSLRLDLDASGNVTAYINGTLVHTTTVTALGITLDTDTGSIYRCGVVGEPGHAALDSFEVWAA